MIPVLAQSPVALLVAGAGSVIVYAGAAALVYAVLAAIVCAALVAIGKGDPVADAQRYLEVARSAGRSIPPGPMLSDPHGEASAAIGRFLAGKQQAREALWASLSGARRPGDHAGPRADLPPAASTPKSTTRKGGAMRVFVTGASGAIGSRLVPQLIDAGHEVIGTHNSPGSAGFLRTLGAKPIMLDLLDASAVREAVLESEPDAIVHEATALASAKFSRNLDRMLAQTNELRTRGLDVLLAAAREAGVGRFVAQSGAGYARYACRGGPVKTEDDPLGEPPAHFEQSFAALGHLERAVLEFGGIALRYGIFYGAANDGSIEPVRKRQFPIVGDGGGVWSWVHLDDAAAATVLALRHDAPAIYNIVDDDPAPVRDWLPVLARSLGAKPPRHLPVWVARIVAGEAMVVMSTEGRGASNEKAKRELGWRLRYPSWRRGFPATYSAPTEADHHPERLAA